MKYTAHTHHSIAVLVLAVACTIVYGHTLNNPFVFDDYHNIRENRHIRVTDLSSESLFAAGFKSPSSRRPVANISFAVNYYLGEYEVRGYHIVNIGIHIINGILVYILGGILFTHSMPPGKTAISQSPGVATGPLPLLAALIFVVHPVQIQSVTYIVQRMNSLAVMFYLLSFVLYLLGRDIRKGWRRWTLFAGSLTVWILAMGTKEIAAPLPLVIFLYEWYFFQDLRKEWLKRNLIFPLAAVLVLGLIACFYFDGKPFEGILAGYQDRDFALGQRVLTQFRVILLYVSLVLFPLPSRLNLLHPVAVSSSLLDPVTTLLSLCAIILFLGLAIAIAKRHRIPSFCILWFFIHLAIESSVIGVEMVFEHRLYLPLVGVALLFGHLISSNRLSKSFWGGIGAISLVVLLGSATIVRNGIWSDRIMLWQDVIAKNPRSARGHTVLASVLREEGQPEAADGHYKEAVRLDPGYVARIHNKKGYHLQSQGRLGEAAIQFAAALGLRPNYANAHNNLGVLLATMGRREEAIQHFTAALALSPGDAQMQRNLENARRQASALPPVQSAASGGASD